MITALSLDICGLLQLMMNDLINIASKSMYRSLHIGVFFAIRIKSKLSNMSWEFHSCGSSLYIADMPNHALDSG